jgi:hypothetical protein
MFVEQGSVLVLESGSSIDSNRAPVGGGAQLNDATELHLKEHSYVTGNAARFDAGGVYSADRSLILVAATSAISCNQAGRFAGGVSLLSNRSDIQDLEAVVTGNKARYSDDIAVITTDLQPTDQSYVKQPVVVDSSGVAVVELQATGWYGRGTPGILVQAVLEPKGKEQDGVIIGVNHTGLHGLVTLRMSFVGYPPGDYPVNISLVGTVEIAMLGFEVPDVDVTIRVPVAPSTRPAGQSSRLTAARRSHSSLSYRQSSWAGSTGPWVMASVVVLLAALLVAALVRRMSSCRSLPTEDFAARDAFGDLMYEQLPNEL